MELKITRATVLLNVGADCCILWTDLPSSMPKVTEQNLSLRFDAEYDKGAEYIRNTFGIEPEVISARPSKK